jgi:hypothetical protein
LESIFPQASFGKFNGVLFIHIHGATDQLFFFNRRWKMPLIARLTSLRWNKALRRIAMYTAKNPAWFVAIYKVEGCARL